MLPIRTEGRMLYQDLETTLEVIALNRRWWICGAHGNYMVAGTQELFSLSAMLDATTGNGKAMDAIGRKRNRVGAAEDAHHSIKASQQLRLLRSRAKVGIRIA